MSRRAPASAVLAVTLAASFPAGCASKLPQTPQSLTIDPPAAAAAIGSGTHVVSLRRADVAPPYAGASLVYRVGDHVVERDPYASLADPPSWMLTAAMRGYLGNAPFIRTVVAPAERVAVDAAVEPLATELYGDFTNPAEPAAVLTVQFRVLAPQADAAVMRAVLLKSYSRRIPVPRRAADAVVAAWNQALAEIMGEFLNDLNGVLPAGSPAS